MSDVTGTTELTWIPTCGPGNCRFKPRFDLKNPTSIRVGLFGMWRRVQWEEIYVKDLCTDCGRVKSREDRE